MPLRLFIHFSFCRILSFLLLRRGESFLVLQEPIKLIDVAVCFIYCLEGLNRSLLADSPSADSPTESGSPIIGVKCRYLLLERLELHTDRSDCLRIL